MFGYNKGDLAMTENERELIKLIRENDNPEKALITAVDTILLFLVQQKSFEAQAVAVSQELA